MARLEVHLFGAFVVRGEQRVPLHFATRKEQELLAYLLLNRDRTVARETLAGRLWGEVTTEQSRTYLRKALWRLRGTLGEAGAALDEPFLRGDHDWLQLEVPPSMWVDAVAFEQALAVTPRAPSDDERGRLEQATACYRGELLEGWYHDWCLYERERMHQQFVAALHRLIAACERAGRPDDAVTHAIRLVRHTPYSERAHRLLMRAYCRAGDRGRALQQFARCRRMLDEELHVAPAAETTALYERIRDGGALDVVVPSMPPPLPAPGHEPGRRLLEAMGHLEQAVRLVLADRPLDGGASAEPDMAPPEGRHP